jgi:hypothetical protein
MYEKRITKLVKDCFKRGRGMDWRHDSNGGDPA